MCASCVSEEKEGETQLFHHFAQRIDAKRLLFQLFENFHLIYTGKNRPIRKSDNIFYY